MAQQQQQRRRTTASSNKSSSNKVSSKSSSNESSSNKSSRSNNQSSRGNNRNGDLKPIELARAARAQLGELTGRVPESVLGIRKDKDGWKVAVEVVELSRVPNSTDLLGIYMVTLDDDGQLLGYERVRRYQRGQPGGDEQ